MQADEQQTGQFQFMSQANQNQNVAQNVDAYTDELSAEATEAVEQIAQTVDTAAQAADEALDLADEVTAALDALSRGDRAAAIDAALSLLGDETGQEAKEVVAALKATRKELERSAEELEDVYDMLVSAASALSEAAEKSEIFQMAADFFDERA